jgi:hypothetical protein
MKCLGLCLKQMRYLMLVLTGTLARALASAIEGRRKKRRRNLTLCMMPLCCRCHVPQQEEMFDVMRRHWGF